MFGFGKKKENPTRARKTEEFEQRKAQNKAQLGIFMGGLDDGEEMEDDDLEKELLNILGESSPSRSPVKKAKVPSSAPPAISKSSVPMSISDNEDEINEEDDIDSDDPDLQAELGELLGEEEEAVIVADAAPAPSQSSSELSSLLQQRLELYEIAKGNADKAGDEGKSRRFTRGIKTLKELLNKVNSGKVVNEEDIPPVVSSGAIKPPPKPAEPEALNPTKQPDGPVPSLPKPLVPEPPPRPKKSMIEAPLPPRPVPHEKPKIDNYDPPAAPEPPVDYENPVPHPQALERLKEYKMVAVILKRNGETAEALQFLKLSKSLEQALSCSQKIDLVTEFPPVPTGLPAAPQPPLPPAPAPSVQLVKPTPEVVDLFQAPPPPITIMDALQQRLDKYKTEVEKAKEAENDGKARRMGRIVKQYEDAIGLYKKGKPVPYDELPTPPGFCPIPIPTTTNSDEPPPQQPSTPASASVIPQNLPAKPSTTPPRPAINRGAVSGSGPTKLTLQEKQLKAVLLRQKQYKDAALEAKKRGDINQAREYLRTSKGFDSLIQASQGGLPVDLKSMPGPPDALLQLEEADYELVTTDDCLIPESFAEIYTKLESDLKEQLKMCMRNREHMRSVGDVPSSNRFEGMALDTKKDLDALRLAAKSGGGKVPKYHYENKTFAITECNTDLKEDEIEINVLRGMNFKASSSIDTFLRVELPYPSAEEAQSQKSSVVKDSTDPEYKYSVKLSITRSARNFQRFIHRHGVKVEVWSKGGFLRGSTLFGTATIKLQPLETKTTLHDAFDVLDGRKIVGKVEVKVRLRDPVLTKEITHKREKWLSIDKA